MVAAAIEGTGRSRVATPRFEVLLATYNGERYLPALLDSVLGQRFQPFTIVARDDCSRDATPAILADYAARHPGRIRILPSPLQRSGPCANFASLISAAEADFIFFCDQDDVWLPDKMKLTQEVMARLVERHGDDCPLLVHTDLAVVGPELEPLDASFFRYAGLDPTRNKLEDLLLGNVATGCTMLLNRALYAAALPLDPCVLMYDHWIAQVAAALGRIAYLDEPTVLYRQHADNVVGVERAGAKRFFRSVRRTLLSDATLSVLRAYSRHAEILLAHYGKRLLPERREQLRALATVWDEPRILRFARLWRSGLRKPSFGGNAAMFLLLLRSGKN
jgi:glycosyltransferase involved in cell wall biosynthesis